MLLQILWLLIGFALLVKGSNFFIDGASAMAQHFKVPKIFIGLTIVAFATSSPELAISIQAMTSGSGDIVLGNVIGSNIINILLLIGVAASISPLRIRSNTIYKEVPLLLLMTLLLASFLLDSALDGVLLSYITRVESIGLLLLFIVFIYYIMSVAKNKNEIKEYHFKEFSLFKSAIYVIIGIVGLIYGANLVVDSSIFIARYFGVSERIISLTIVALGTSLPELTTTLVASFKKEKEILIGNIIGSNMFNIGIVLGLPVLLFGGIPASKFTYVDLFILLLSSILLFIFAKSNRVITKREGKLMLLLLSFYYFYLFLA